MNYYTEFGFCQSISILLVENNIFQKENHLCMLF